MELNIHYVESHRDPKEGEQYLLRVGFCDCTYTSQFVDEFVYELGVRIDSIEARKKIDALALTETEWDRIGIFCSLLRVRIKR